MPWFQSKFPISTAEKVSVERHLDWWIGHFGQDRLFDFTPIDLRSFEHLDTRLDEFDQLQQLVEFVAEYLPSIDNINFQIVDLETPFPEATGKPAPFILREQLANIEETVSQIAVSLMSIYLSNLEEDSDVAWTDWMPELAAALCGFGVAQANSSMSIESMSFGEWSYTKQIRYRLVPARIFGVILAYVAWLTELEKPRWSLQLRPDALTPFKSALQYLRKTADSTLVVNGERRIFDNPKNDQLLSQFQGETETVRLAIAQELFKNISMDAGGASLQSSSLSPLLIDASDDIRSFACACIEGLESISTRELGLIADLTTDKNSNIRSQAILAIAKHAPPGGPDQFNIRRHLQDSSQQVVDAAVYAASRLQIQDNRILDQLSRTLQRALNQSPFPSLVATCRALEAITGDAASLIQDLVDADQIHEALDALRVARNETPQ